MYNFLFIYKKNISWSIIRYFYLTITFDLNINRILIYFVFYLYDRMIVFEIDTIILSAI